MSCDSYEELRERVNRFVFENLPDKVNMGQARDFADEILAKLDPFNWSTTPPPPTPSEPTDFYKHTTTMPPDAIPERAVPPVEVPGPPDPPRPAERTEIG